VTAYTDHSSRKKPTAIISTEYALMSDLPVVVKGCHAWSGAATGADLDGGVLSACPAPWQDSRPARGLFAWL
jgi:hypothetical protein